ncbi:hypothetical protein MMC11_002200 [Xylographa trunciseda]|nr:hypothetical protein [Xylographa trunciseda]
MSVTHPLPQHDATRPLQTFRHDVEVALKAYLTSGQKPYQKVIVVLTSWDNAPANEGEIDALEDVLQKIYNFETVRFRIPVLLTATRQLFKIVSETMIRADKQSDLVIFYYGGHATHEFDKQRAHGAGRSLIIHSNPFHGRVFADTAAGSLPTRTAQVDLTDILRCSIEVFKSTHVLYILDCCYASSIAVRGPKELLAACASDRTTPGAGYPGSFTRVLVETLAKAKGCQFTVAQLHGAMTRAFYDNELTAVPVHVELSAEMVTHGSIVLAPLRNGTTDAAPHQQVPRPFGTPRSNPKVLVSIHLSDVHTPPNAQQWTQWLSTYLPSGAKEIQIQLVGFYQTSSSVLLVMLPVEVWTVLRGDPPYVLVSIVTSANMMPGSTSYSGGVGGLAPRNSRQENNAPGRDMSSSSKDVGRPSLERSSFARLKNIWLNPYLEARSSVNGGLQQ